LKPISITANKNQKRWANESEYAVGTAGSENTGRSLTINFLHLSEAAQYKDWESIKAGLLQCVSDASSNEIWVESTAFGMNWFYLFTMDSLAGKTGFEVIFIPWFWSYKYRLPAPSDFERTEEEESLAARGTFFNNKTKTIDLRPLDNDQLHWRREKIKQLGDRIFKQEYPATLQEAFQASGQSFIAPELVQKARQSTLEETYGPLILGVDAAREGDRTVLSLRHGRQFTKIWKYETMDEMKLAGIVANLIEEYDIDKVFIDYGMGYGTVDRLVERGFGAIVEGVSFSQAPYEERFLNKRAEMIYALRDWLKDGEVRLPDDEDMAADLGAIPDSEPTSNGKLKFPSKADIKKNFGKSPDIADSMVLTFAEKVRAKDTQGTLRTGYTEGIRPGGSELSTLSRVRGGEGFEGYDRGASPVQTSFRRSGREAF
jgi:hypothetical protein